MAYDTGVICHECYGECVGAVFCGNAGQDTPDVRLPKTLTVQIEANPAFWGFGGVLFSGDVTYGSSSFDYWDNFDENWLTDKTCNSTTIRDLDNEQRPDVSYRSVYDPDSGVVTYDGNTEIDSLGGPAVYLIDRDATKTTDASSCDETDPADVFRHHPENFGFGNKILFEEDIYKNISAAWRGVDSGNPNFVANESGLPDGAVAGPYTGDFETSGILRDGSDPFIHFHVNYTGQPASGIMSGSLLYLKNSNVSQVPDGAYYVAKVEHQPTYTDCMIVGTVGSEEFEADTSGVIWTVANSYDEQTCYGKAAHGVDPIRKKPLAVKNYHTDLGLIINDSRNRIHSNRATRDKWGMTNTRTNDGPRRDYNYVSVQESGHGFLVKPEDSNTVALACQTGVWNPTWDFIYTSGTTYYSAYEAQDIPDTGLAKDLSDTYGSGTILGTVDINPLPGGWSQYAVSSGMVPLYSRELSFYGPFYEVYEKDNEVRTWQQDNTINARNLTCYTKKATLEVFPDCITQEQEYEKCGGGYTHTINNISRLAFVYRCFDYPDPCSYDESGLPYNGMPTNVDELRTGLAGQEVYMYINWSAAWAGMIVEAPPCGCTPPVIPGTPGPVMMPINSPVTFPCFPKFDLDPSGYGAQDQIWKMAAAAYLNVEDGTFDCDCPIEATGDYAFQQQPYTTYGFIRNICGKETNSSKEVIQALNGVNAGTYRNTTPTDDTVEPMYWEFPIISGDINGTDTPWNSGLSGGFINDSGTLATWGIVDQNNRLVAPYYPMTTGLYTDICGNSTAYADFDKKAAFRGEWPKDEVPFLIRIDHDNHCVGCDLTNMDTTHPMSVSFQSLDGTYYHNDTNRKYGHNNCPYELGFREERTWNCDSGVFNSGSTCAIETDFLPYTGQTCETINSFDYPFIPQMLEGTQIPKYWSTQNPNNADNAFVPVPDLFVPVIYGLGGNTDPSINGLEVVVYAAVTMDCGAGYYDGLYECSYGDNLYGQDIFYNPLSTFYSCGDCSHSYPGVNNRSTPQVKYIGVNAQFIENFESMTTNQIFAGLTEGWLCNGADATWSADTLTATTDLPACTGSKLTFYGCLWPGIPEGGLQGCEPSGSHPCGFISNPDSQTPNGCAVEGPASGFCDTLAPGDYNDLGCLIRDDCDNITDVTIGGIDVPIENLASPIRACTCHCYDRFDEIAQYTYDGSQWVLDYHNCSGTDSTAIIKAFSGSGIPNIGEIGPLPVNKPLACDITDGSLTDYCVWKDDADSNNFVDVDYKIYSPGNANTKDPADIPCGGLWPNYCDEQWGVCSGDANVYKSTCGTPIYGDDSVRVRRKRAHPEIMTVHKIDCLGEGSGYNLHVSREYHDHSRAWRYPIDGYTCDFYQGAVEGGGYNWRRSNNTADTQECPTFYFHPCSGADLNEFAQVWPAVDTGDPNYNLEGPVPSYYLLPHSIPSDQVTPAWPTENDSADSTARSLCTFHPHSGSLPNYHVTRDFQKTITPYRSAHTEWIQMSDENGIVQRPLYTGVLDTPDTGVYGDYCDATVATGDPVSIWISRGRVYLPSSITDNLESAGLNANTQESGALSCSGELWAVSGEPLLQYDQNGTVRYFTAESLATSQCDTNQRYPDLSGVTLWNYYNLFYGSGFPDSKYYNYVDLIQPDEEGDCNDPGRHPPPWNFNPTQGGPPSNTGDPHFGPIYTDPDDVPLNRRHSCIQDSTVCGGELWNNKMFFPRKPYESGTRVTAFGALSLCTQDATYETASWLEGYEDLSANGEVDLLREAKQTRFIDACDFDAHSVELQADVGIDDVIIHVDDYLPLLGMYFVDRKTKLGDWTCLQPDSGCYEFLPIHSDQTLDAITFTPGKTWGNDQEVSLGYHLDKIVTTAQDQCLFKPFKIMVDVDCCPDVIRKVGQEGDEYESTWMQWIDTTSSSVICRAMGSNARACSCSDTQCGNEINPEFFVPTICGKWYTVNEYLENTGPFCSGPVESGGFIYDSGGVGAFGNIDCSGATVATSYYTLDGGSRYITGPDYEPTFIGSGLILDGTPSQTTCPSGADGELNICAYQGGFSYVELWDVCGVTCELTGSGADVPGYECNGYYYYDVNAIGHPSGCCQNLTYCDIIQGSQTVRFTSTSDCIIDSGIADYSVEYTGCACSEQMKQDYLLPPPDLCSENHNILITISEDE